jgi:hypothetical protein
MQNGYKKQPSFLEKIVKKLLLKGLLQGSRFMVFHFPQKCEQRLIPRSRAFALTEELPVEREDMLPDPGRVIRGEGGLCGVQLSGLAALNDIQKYGTLN